MNTWRRLGLCLAVAVALVALARPALTDPGIEVDKDARAEVVVGDDAAKRIVIREIHCEGEGCEEHEGAHNMVFVGGGGDIKVMTGDDGHAWVTHLRGLGEGGGYLGVGLTELTPELREHFGVPADAGVMVSKVMDDSLAFKAGLEPGDIIVEVDGDSVANSAALAKMIRGHAEGEEVLLGFWRNGSARSITVAIDERDEDLGFRHIGHLGHVGDVSHLRKIMVHCDSEDKNCEPNLEIAGLNEFDCGGSEECEVRVECKAGGCTCSINGEEADCDAIPGVSGVGD
ncbi:MAG: PDZ domain-containing protein [bacterium]|nr:PDZ domain-containing protein [bacterium]